MNIVSAGICPSARLTVRLASLTTVVLPHLHAVLLAW